MHQKHAKLERAAGGQFHRLELGFLGAPCGVIQKLCSDIAGRLKEKHSIGYVDADHGEGEEKNATYSSILTDKISFQRIDSQSVINKSRPLLAEHDAVFVNGNHYKTDRQIVLVNEKKKNSLFRKMNRIGKVEMIILDGVEKPFDFLKKFKNVPVFKIEEIEKITEQIENLIVKIIPKIIGLVFAGGKSSRMGTDKGEIVYHKKNQREHLAVLLSDCCSKVYFSGAANQVFESDFETIQDTFLGLGPFGGLVSAFQKFPNQAIFSLPVDVPFVDKKMLDTLLKNRDPRKVATCFHNPETNFPEPLITIWEPKAYPILLEYLSRGYSCPRKILINSDICELKLAEPEKLFNANTPEQMNFAKKNVNRNS